MSLRYSLYCKKYQNFLRKHSTHLMLLSIYSCKVLSGIWHMSTKEHRGVSCSRRSCFMLTDTYYLLFFETGSLTCQGICRIMGIRSHSWIIILCPFLCVYVSMLLCSEWGGSGVLWLAVEARGQPSGFGPHLLTCVEMGSPCYCQYQASWLWASEDLCLPFPVGCLGSQTLTLCGFFVDFQDWTQAIRLHS